MREVECFQGKKNTIDNGMNSFSISAQDFFSLSDPLDDLRRGTLVKITLKLISSLHQQLDMQTYSNEGNPYVMDTRKRFSVEEESRLCRIKSFRSNDEKGPVFICFQTGIFALDGMSTMFRLRRVQMLIKGLALSNNP